MKLKLVHLAFVTLLVNCLNAQNLLGENTGFSEKDKFWVTGSWGDEKGKPEGDFYVSQNKGQDGKSGFMRVEVTKPTINADGFKLFVKKEGIKLKKKKTYKLVFWVASTVRQDHIGARIYSGPDTGSNSPWAPVMDKTFAFEGNKKWQRLEYIFAARSLWADKEADLSNLAFVLGFDKRVGPYHVDNISLERVKR